MLIADADAGKLTAPVHEDPDAILGLLDERSIDYTTWDGWYRLDEAERKLGEECATHSRERKKIVEWDEMVSYAHHKQ